MLGVINVEGLIVHGFPMMFGLSVFLTLAYYGLDHFNPANRKRRDEWEAKGWSVSCRVVLCCVALCCVTFSL